MFRFKNEIGLLKEIERENGNKFLKKKGKNCNYEVPGKSREMENKCQCKEAERIFKIFNIYRNR